MFYYNVMPSSSSQHPSIYRVTDDDAGGKTYTRVSNLDSSPYYRWDKSNAPETVAFPPGFRFIAHSDDPGSDKGGETGENMLVECCDKVGEDEEESCETWSKLHFPTRSCDWLGIALGTCGMTACLC